MPLLCHQASICRHHMEAPRGFSRAHLGLGGVLLPQPIRAVVGHNPPVPREQWPLSVVRFVLCACVLEGVQESKVDIAHSYSSKQRFKEDSHLGS